MKILSLVAVILLASAAEAIADVRFIYDGTVNTITYANTPADTPSPFTLGERVLGSVNFPNYGPGRFTIYSDGDFAYNGTVLGKVGQAVPGFSSSLVFGSFSEDFLKGRLESFQGDTSASPAVSAAFFCCSFSGLREDGQALFSGNSFTALFLPTGQGGSGQPQITATGSGTWRAEVSGVVPEPASLGLLAGALAAFGLARRRRLVRRSGAGAQAACAAAA